MLKWTVIQRVSSSVSSSCSETTPSITCCSSSAFKQSTLKSQTLSAQRPRPRRSYNRCSGVEDKENRRQCRRSLEKELMRTANAEVSSVPNALRDVSNKWSPNCENVTPIKNHRKFKRKSGRLKKSPCTIPQHHCKPPQPISSTPNVLSNWCNGNVQEENAVKSADNNVIEKKKQPCLNVHKHEFPLYSTDLKNIEVENVTQTDANYRPENLTTQIHDNKLFQPLIPSSEDCSIVVDNPLYFTIQTSPPDEPDLLFHKALPVSSCRSVIPSYDSISRSDKNPINNRFFSRLNSQISEVSPLARRLAWLRITSKMEQNQSVQPVPNNHALDIKYITEESTTESPDNKAWNANVDNGNKKKVHRIKRPKRKSSFGLFPDNCKRSNLRNQHNDDTTDRLEIENPDDESVTAKRRCLIFNELTFSLNSPPLTEIMNHSSGTDSIDLNAPSSLKRQRVIRRPKDKSLMEKNINKLNKNDAKLPYQRIFQSCLTLPDGIPSPLHVTKGKFQISSPPLKFISSENFNRLEIPNIPVANPCLETKQLPLETNAAISPGIEPLHDSSISSAYDSEEKHKSGSFKRKVPDLVNMSVSQNSESTWNSHENRLPKIPRFMETDLEFVADDNSLNQSNNSSKIQDDQEMFTSTASSTQTLYNSPMVMVEKNSRSRRCLSFMSPKSQRNRIRRDDFKSGYDNGQLEVEIYKENENLVIHVKRARNLHRLSGESSCNAYIKVNLIPSNGSLKCCHRTCVRKDSCHPKFDHKFTMELSEPDIIDKRILISAWHRDRGNRKSEFLGCMSFAVKNVLKKEIIGTYKLLSQISSIKSQHTSLPNQRQWSSCSLDLMANQSESSIDERILTGEVEKLQTPDIGEKKLMTITRKEVDKGDREDYMFLQHLELDSTNENKRGGRTPFTTMYKLLKQSNGSYGFSIAWTHPPRVERVEANLPADKAGLRPGDNVVFVNKTNVVTLPEEKILEIIKACGNHLTLEIYRKPIVNGTIANMVAKYPAPASGSSMLACSSRIDTKSNIAFSTATDISKQPLQLPQVAFSIESRIETIESTRQHAIYQLLRKEQQYALCLQFGISRFLLPLAERRDVIKQNEHQTIFQNIQELLRITEDISEQLIQDEGEIVGNQIGKVYLKKLPVMNAAYKQYCCGLKKSDCILVEKTRNLEFMKIISEPPIPKKRPDLITFIHKPLEHYRDILKILQTISSCKTHSSEQDNRILLKLVSELQAAYREITVESGLMESGSEGRPLLSLQDLESRLVFTKCKPFVLTVPGRKWIFGGDLNRVEGRSIRLFWTLLFSDILLLAKINRDRVVFVTEEPLPLVNIMDTQFNIKKKATEFRLIIGCGWKNGRPITPGNGSPAQPGCVPMMNFHSPLSKTSQNKGIRKRTIIFRAPSVELKAVWQNLIQRQILKINTTGQGISPLTSPMESPNQLPSESLVTLDTMSTMKNHCQHPGMQINEIIDHKCRQLGKCTGKGRAYHLSQWMKGELDGNTISQSESDPEVETWSEEDLKRRSAEIGKSSSEEVSQKEVESISDSKNYSQNIYNTNTDESVPKISICQKCHNRCTRSPINRSKWEGNSGSKVSLNDDNRCNLDTKNILLSPTDPFNPIPNISVTPPDSPHFKDWVTASEPSCAEQNEKFGSGEELYEDCDKDAENPKEKVSIQRRSSPAGLKRYSSFANIDMLSDNEQLQRDSDSIEQVISSGDSKKNVDKKCDKENYNNTADTTVSWASRASSFVAHKVALFERIGENVQTSSFLERYWRLSLSDTINKDSISIKQTIAFEEEGEISGGTSGDEFWGTPNSGGASLASNECGALSPGSAEDDEEDDEISDQLAVEELLNRSNMLTQHNITPSRILVGKTRLETLPEDEEELSDSSSSSSEMSLKSSSSTNSGCTMSCPITQVSNNISNGTTIMYCENMKQTHGIFKRLKLRRTLSADCTDSARNCLNKTRTESDESFQKDRRIKRNKLLSLFSRPPKPSGNVNSIERGNIDIRCDEKGNTVTDMKFWKHLKQRKRKSK